MNIAKQKRLSRIMNLNNQRSVIVPLDHGTSIGSVHGIGNIQKTVSDMVEGNANALLMHKGLIRNSGVNNHPNTGLIMHLSASTALAVHSNTKVLVGTVEEALMNGADAVSIHLNIGDENEGLMLRDAGIIAESCEKWGMPLLMMVYGRGPNIKNQYSPEVVGHCARIGAELGADLVKVAYTGDIESFSKVVDGCPVPVVIAGGECLETEKDVLQMAYDSLLAGARGLSIGRNIFQCKNRIRLMHALNAIVHKNCTVEEALSVFKANPKLSAQAA